MIVIQTNPSCLDSIYLELTKSSKIIKKKYKEKEKVQVLFY
jgi:hypothetical protein